MNTPIRHFLSFLFLAIALHASAADVITTFAGNLIPSGTATNIGVGASGVAIDSSNNVYFADSSNHVIRKINVTTGTMTVIAGSGSSGFSGDGGAATSAKLNSPKGVAIDSSGNLYIADTSNHRIRKIDASTGNIATIAGTGTGTFGGDNAAATAARVNSPQGVAVDSSGNVYIADTSNNRIRKIDVTSGNISTVAGNGTGGYLADNVAATGTRINAPRGVVVDSSGNLYIADTSNNRIRKVSTGGTITTYAGTGAASFSGDNGAAISATIRAPQALTLDSSGNMYIADTTNHRIRKITSGIITTLSGTGSGGYSGDNGVATSGQLSSPAGIAVDSSGNIYIGDTGNLRLRKISGGNISTAAGTGSATYGGDGGVAIKAQFTSPQQIVIDSAGNFYLSDSGTHRVRKMATDGTVTTIAGTGVAGYSGDNGPATSAKLNTPLGITLDSSGNLYIADGNNNRIRKVDTSGTITTFAGDGSGAFGGDNGVATSAQIFGPFGVLALGSNIYITDTGNNRVRKVDAGGTITTIAGSGTAGFAGDNGAATSAQFNTPIGIAADSAGNLYITDYSNGSIRKISTGGTVTTVAGNGANGYGGDGGAATSAQLNSPRGVAVDTSGNIYITDGTNNRIRKVDIGTGNISTIAGTGTAGFSGDEGAPASAQVSTPQAITVTSSGVIYFGDTGNRRFRRIGPPLAATVSTGSASNTSSSGATLGGTVNDNGLATTVSFDYGTTTGYGSNAGATTGGTLSAGSGSTSVAVTLSSLSCGTLYHFRVVGTNSGGTANGSDQTVSTSACGNTPVPSNPFNPSGIGATSSVVTASNIALNLANSSLVTNLSSLGSNVGISDNGVLVILATPSQPVRLATTTPDNILISLPAAQNVPIVVGGNTLNVASNTDPVKNATDGNPPSVLATKTFTDDQGRATQSLQIVTGQASVSSGQANQIVGGLTLSQGATLRDVYATTAASGTTVGFYKNPLDFSGAIAAESGDVTVVVTLAASSRAAARNGAFAATGQTISLKVGEVVRFDSLGQVSGIFLGSLSGRAGKTGDRIVPTPPDGFAAWPDNIVNLAGSNVPARLGMAYPDAIRAATAYTLSQDASSGQVSISGPDGARYHGLPLDALKVQSGLADGFLPQSDGSISLTVSGVTARFVPAIANPVAFASALANQFNLQKVWLTTDGTYVINTNLSDGYKTYRVTPRFAETAGSSAPANLLTYAPGDQRMVFAGSNGFQQVLDPDVWGFKQISAMVQAMDGGWNLQRRQDGTLLLAAPSGQTYVLLPDYAITFAEPAVAAQNDINKFWVGSDGKLYVQFMQGFLPFIQGFTVK
jgi:sugar lactone lactonase YvrE